MFDGKYIDWNQKRIKTIVDFYGHKFFFYKKILDLGCGYADISGVLHRLGSDITAVDARQEHLKMVAKKYPGIKTVKADLDRGWPFHNKKFDLTLDLDLISHLNDYESHLKMVCAYSTHLIIETAVCDSDDPFYKVIFAENKNMFDLSMNGVACLPSAVAIERILLESNMNFKRIDHPKLNSGSYIYDWVPVFNNECNNDKRRFWFAVKNDSPIQFSNKKSETYDIQQIQATPPPTTVGHLQVPTSIANQILTPAPSSYLNKLNTQGKTFSFPAQNVRNIPRVAVCLSGHLRTFDRTYKSLMDNLVNPLSADVFIHTWETIGSQNSKVGSDRHTSAVSTNSRLKDINSFYNPKKINIENFDKKYFIDLGNKVSIAESDKIYVANHLGYHFAMFYSIKKANDLKIQAESENGFKYDYVIRIRPDIFLETKLNDSFFPAQKNCIVTPIIAQYHSDGINDQIAIGSSESMDKYCSLFNNKLQYCQDRVSSIRPESLLRYHTSKNEISIEKRNIQYLIIRVDGTILKQS
jgi:SAM-dependent methyltransferase